MRKQSSPAPILLGQVPFFVEINPISVPALLYPGYIPDGVK